MIYLVFKLISDTIGSFNNIICYLIISIIYNRKRLINNKK